MGFKAKSRGIAHLPSIPTMEQIWRTWAQCRGLPDPESVPRRIRDPEAKCEQLYRQNRAILAINVCLQQGVRG